jgi:hypothetical protein
MTAFIDKIETLAKDVGANEEWWDATALEVVLSEIQQEDAAFIAACSPAAVLAMVAGLRAAKDLRNHLERVNCLTREEEPFIAALDAALEAMQ